MRQKPQLCADTRREQREAKENERESSRRKTTVTNKRRFQFFARVGGGGGAADRSRRACRCRYVNYAFTSHDEEEIREKCIARAVQAGRTLAPSPVRCTTLNGEGHGLEDSGVLYPPHESELRTPEAGTGEHHLSRQ